MTWGIRRASAITAASALVLSLMTASPVYSDTDPCLSAGAIVGTPGNDVLTGTSGKDVICGLGGDDTINSLEGDDAIYAGDGDDRIVTVEGNDYVEGGEGDDFIDSGVGDDTLLGNIGDDILWGGAGVDELLGLAGSDSLNGGVGADVLDGGIDRNYCAKDPNDTKSLNCFFDSKAPEIKAVSIDAANRVINTAEGAQWVSGKALIAESGSGLSAVSFAFIDATKKDMPSLGSYSSTLLTCEALEALSKTNLGETYVVSSQWCIEKKSTAGVLVKFLYGVPWRQAKGVYKLTAIRAEDNALNKSKQNGLWFNASIKQSGSAPTGSPVLKSFEFLSPNKIDTSRESKTIVAQAVISIGPLGLTETTISFHRTADAAKRDNGLRFWDEWSLKNNKFCPPETTDKLGNTVPILKETLTASCILKKSASSITMILVGKLPKNSPKGTYRFSYLELISNLKGAELNSAKLKADIRYTKFLNLAVVQSSTSAPVVIDGSVDLTGIQASVSKISTGSGPASFDVLVNLRRNGAAANWNLSGSLEVLYCPSGTIRKYTNQPNSKNSAESIPEGEFCSYERVEDSGKKYWFPGTNFDNPILSKRFNIGPGQSTVSVPVTIPANFKKGLIVIGLGTLMTDIGLPTYLQINGNWDTVYEWNDFNKKAMGALTCGTYLNCTGIYSRVTNG